MLQSNNQIIVCTPEQLTQIVEQAITARFDQAETKSNGDIYPPLLTRRQVAELLGVAIQTVDNWTRDGRLTKHRNSRTVRYKKDEVLAAFKMFHKHQRNEPQGA